MRQKIVDNLKKKTRIVVFTGGECTTRNDLPELISYATKKGMKAGIETNKVSYVYDFKEYTTEYITMLHQNSKDSVSNSRMIRS